MNVIQALMVLGIVQLRQEKRFKINSGNFSSLAGAGKRTPGRLLTAVGPSGQMEPLRALISSLWPEKIPVSP